jgi:hypothetical protein
MVKRAAEEAEAAAKALVGAAPQTAATSAAAAAIRKLLRMRTSVGRRPYARRFAPPARPP